MRRTVVLVGALIAALALVPTAGARGRHHVRHVLNSLIAEGGAIESREAVARQMHVSSVGQPFPVCRSVTPRRELCKVVLQAEEREWGSKPVVTRHLECRWRVRVRYQPRYPFEKTSRPIHKRCRRWTTTEELFPTAEPLPEPELREPEPIEIPPVVIPPSLAP